jgi:hypothetical protein
MRMSVGRLGVKGLQNADIVVKGAGALQKDAQKAYILNRLSEPISDFLLNKGIIFPAVRVILVCLSRVYIFNTIDSIALKLMKRSSFNDLCFIKILSKCFIKVKYCKIGIVFHGQCCGAGAA